MATMTEIAAHLEQLLMSLGVRNVFIILAILYVGLFYAISRLCGWHDLAKQYAGQQRYQGEWLSHPEGDDPKLGGLVVYFKNITSENAIKMGADREGLYLETSLGFRLFHPPLFIPWNDVSSTALREVPWLKKKNLVRFTFAMHPDIPVSVDTYVAREIEKRSQGRWTLPELD